MARWWVGMDETREAIRDTAAKQSAEMQKKRQSRPGPAIEGGVSVAQRFKNWLNEDRLPKYMQQPGQDEYGRSQKKKAEAAAAEFKKNPPSQKNARYSPNDIRMQKITPYKPTPKTTPSVSTPPASVPSAALKKQEVVMGTAPATRSENPTPPKKPQQATPTVSRPSSIPKPRNYSREAMDMLGGSDKGALDEDNAVMKKLRERAGMSAAERDKAPKFESKYADKLNKAMGYAKGGNVMAAKKGSMEDFMSVLGEDNAVFKKLRAREIGRNPPKSMSGSTTLPAPKVTTGSWSPAPEGPAPKTKKLISSTKQPELDKIISRPLAARDSAKATMSDAAKKKFESMRSSRTKDYAKGGHVKANGIARKGKTRGRLI